MISPSRIVSPRHKQSLLKTDIRMDLRKTVATLALLIACFAQTPAQESQCSLKIAQLKPAPELYGLRIGMTIDQVRAIVPTLQTSGEDDMGFSTSSFSPDFNPQMDKTRFAGVRTVSLEFLDGNLLNIWIGFNGSFKWKTLEEFVSGISGSLGVPAEAWSGSTTKPSMDCEEMEITVSMIAGGPSIRLVDKAARELWEQRRTEREQKRSDQGSEEP